jgi:hypothetical protein
MMSIIVQHAHCSRTNSKIKCRSLSSLFLHRKGTSATTPPLSFHQPIGHKSTKSSQVARKQAKQEWPGGQRAAVHQLYPRPSMGRPSLCLSSVPRGIRPCGGCRRRRRRRLLPTWCLNEPAYLWNKQEESSRSIPSPTK